MHKYSASGITEELLRTKEGRYLLNHTVEMDDLAEVIRSAPGVEEETKEQVLAGLTHVADSGGVISFFVLAALMGELMDVIEDRPGMRKLLEAIGDSGERMPICSPPIIVH